MKSILFSVILSISIFINAKGQSHRKVGFAVSFPNTYGKSFFKMHPDVDRVVLQYKNDKATVLNLYKHQTDKPDLYEKYYLTFEGDRYLLDKRYRNLILPDVAKLRIEYLAGISNLSDSANFHIIETTLKRDSIIYFFNYYTVSENNKGLKGSVSNSSEPKKNKVQIYRQPNSNTVYDTVYPNQARFKGNVSELQKKLELSFPKWKPIAVGDSIVFVSGVVDKNGSLGKLNLEVGEPSQFSRKVSEILETGGHDWWPAVVSSGNKVNYKAKFFVRLNPDGTFKISIL